MRVYRGFSDTSLKPRARAVAIGIFDGVHRGHSLILRKALASAKKLRASATVVTFDPHPQKVLSPGRTPKILMSLEHRLHFFATHGVKETVVVPFNKGFSRVSHQDFLKKLLLKKLGMRSLSVGEDFRFGRKALGGRDYLKKESRAEGFALFLSPALSYKGRPVSSTRIRERIEKGDLKEASRMLGRPVSVSGTVVHGRSRGSRIGFPTANLNPHHETLPPPGVYAARGELGGKYLQGVVHIGERPTFQDRRKTLEVHFLDFHRPLYGREIELAFLGRLRGVRTFPDARVLVRQIRKDILRARALFRSR